MAQSIPLTEAQVVRQVRRLKEVIFREYQEHDDGTYEGEIIEEVLEIIQSILSSKTELSEIEFLAMISEGTKMLVKLLEERAVGVDERVLHFFAFDFMTQTLDFMNGIEVSKIEDDYDPMFN